MRDDDCEGTGVGVERGPSVMWTVLQGWGLSLEKAAGAGSTQVRQAGPHTGDSGAAGQR